MNDRKLRLGRWIFGFLLLALMVEVVLFIPRRFVQDNEGATKATNSPSNTNEPDSKKEQMLDGVHTLEAQGGKKEWELWAKTAVRPKNAGLWLIEQVRIDFFKENQPVFHVDGNKGEIREAVKELGVEGNVIVKSAKGHRFETEKVNYNSEKKSLISPTPVKMIGATESGGGTFDLQAKRMTADLETNLIQVHQNVRSKKSLKGNRVMKIQSDNAEFSGQRNYAKFLGNVVIDVDTTRITGPEAEFKYKPNTDDVESLAVRGGVRMSDLDRWATAHEVLFELASERYIFEGSPRLVQGSDEVLGEKIVVSDGGKAVEIFNAKAKVDKERVEKSEARK